MTRETKLGLGVGASFLSLVAVVAFSTLKKGEEPPPPLPDMPKSVSENRVPAPSADPASPSVQPETLVLTAHQELPVTAPPGGNPPVPGGSPPPVPIPGGNPP